METITKGRVVVLRQYSFPLDAEIAKGILNGAGIMCEINNFTWDTFSYKTIRWETINLLVNEENIELANKILDAKFIIND